MLDPLCAFLRRRVSSQRRFTSAFPTLLFTLQDPNTVPGWSLSTRRSHILRILEQVLSVLGSMEDSWQSWRQASAQSEAHLQSHLVGNQDQYSTFCQVC